MISRHYYINQQNTEMLDSTYKKLWPQLYTSTPHDTACYLHLTSTHTHTNIQTSTYTVKHTEWDLPTHITTLSSLYLIRREIITAVSKKKNEQSTHQKMNKQGAQKQ